MFKKFFSFGNTIVAKDSLESVTINGNIIKIFIKDKTHNLLLNYDTHEEAFKDYTEFKRVVS